MAETEVDNVKEEVEMTPEIFFGLLVSAGKIGHIKHLQTTGEGSYAAHMALKEFYTSAPELADAVIETYQGHKLKIVKYDESSTIFGMDEETSAIEYLESLKDTIEDYRYEVIPQAGTSHIHNELDNFITLIDSTLYKLTFLK